MTRLTQALHVEDLRPSKRPQPPELVRHSWRLLFFVSCCFFFSGAAGLIYQVLWVRMIDKVIGSAPFAVATVLSVFMGGLALGSYLAGRYIDRLASQNVLLSIYGKLEVIVGLYALVLPFLINAARPLYQFLYALLFSSFWFYQVFAFLGCLLLLILPTSLMGATLPVLCRFYVTRMDHLSTRSGTLYGLNTIGAAFGAIFCGFFLLSTFGVWGTLLVAAGINLLVGGACIIVAAKRREKAAASRTVRRGKKNSKKLAIARIGRNENDSQETRNCALWIFGVSGFCAMAYEVIWTRFLGLLMGPTTYSFTLVVSTFIIGLAMGSIIFGWLGDRVKGLFLLLAWTQVLASILALTVSQFLGTSQFLFAKLIHLFQDNFQAMIVAQSLLLFAVLLGPTIFLGATFPLVNRIYARSLSVLGKSIGKAYAMNTVGAILGSFSAGFIIIPLLGKEGGLRLVVTMQLVAALLALTRTGVAAKRRCRFWPAWAVAALLGFFLLIHFPSWNRTILSRGWYRNFEDVESELDRTSWLDALWNGPELLARQQAGLEVVFYGDGIGGFTTVEKETTSLGTVEYALYNSGKADASSHGDRSTQTLSAHVPLLFHPAPEKVMVLGLASGMTSGEVLHYPVKQLNVLEINEQVVTACRDFFTPWNNACLSDPRTRLIVQDGRNHLALTAERYDVIISEPSNPWMAGLANLFTLDFFRLVKERLREPGIFAQWIQSYEMDWDAFALLGRTFTQVFPGGIMMKIGPVDYLLIGFAGMEGFDWKTAEKNISYARRSTNVSFRNSTFLVHLVMTEDLPGLFGPGLLHTDNRPHLEFSAPRKLHTAGLDLDGIVGAKRRLSLETSKILETNSDPDTFLDFIAFAGSANVPLFSMLDLESLSAAQKDRYMRIVRRFCQQALVPSYQLLPAREPRKECAEIHVAKIRDRLSVSDPLGNDYYNLGLALIAADRKDEAIEAFRQTVSLDSCHEGAFTALGLLLAEAGRLPEAAAHLSRAVDLAPLDAEAHKNLAMAQARQGNLERAIMHLDEALRISPRDVVALNELGTVELARGKIGEAVERYTAALTLDPGHAESHHNLGMAFFQQGDLKKALKHFSEALRISPGNANVRYNMEKVLRLLDQPRKTPTGSQLH